MSGSEISQVTDGCGGTWFRTGSDRFTEADTLTEAQQRADSGDMNTAWKLSDIERVWGIR